MEIQKRKKEKKKLIRHRTCTLRSFKRLADDIYCIKKEIDLSGAVKFDKQNCFCFVTNNYNQDIYNITLPSLLFKPIEGIKL